MPEAPPPREDRKARAVLLMFVAVFMFTLIDSSAKWLAQADLPVAQIVFARYAGAFLVVLAIFLPRQGFGSFRANRPGLQALRAAALMFSTFFNFMALSYLPITVTIAFFFATPIVTTLLAIPFLKEVVGFRRLAAIVVGFVGVLVLIQPWGASFHWAMIFSVGALFCASSYFVLTRAIAGEDNNSTSQIWASGLATVVLLPIALRTWVWPENSVDMFVFLMIGFIGATSHIIATYAHRLAEASVLAPIVYAQAIYATIIGYLVFANLPNFWTIVGSAIIISSGIYIWQRERQLQ